MAQHIAQMASFNTANAIFAGVMAYAAQYLAADLKWCRDRSCNLLISNE
jgi:hypothetical protein